MPFILGSRCCSVYFSSRSCRCIGFGQDVSWRESAGTEGFKAKVEASSRSALDWMVRTWWHVQVQQSWQLCSSNFLPDTPLWRCLLPRGHSLPIQWLRLFFEVRLDCFWCKLLGFKFICDNRCDESRCDTKNDSSYCNELNLRMQKSQVEVWWCTGMSCNSEGELWITLKNISPNHLYQQ